MKMGAGSIEEIKIRQLTNQHLITPTDKLTAVRDLCGIQAQFMVNVMHSLKIRCHDYEEGTLGDGLVKNWTIRGTVHVFAETDLPLFLHCNDGKDYRRNEWDENSFWNQRESWALTPERQKYFAEVILAALQERPYTREELKDVCRAGGMTEAEESSMFEAWGGGIRELCERGFLHYVVQEKKAFCLSPEFVPIPEKQAKLEIARRYFTHMAPATIHDAMYYFHTSAAQVKEWLKELPVESIECGGRTYYYIENGSLYQEEIPKCLFLAGFDQLMLAYDKKESLYLKPENRRAIFNLAGIVMPAVLLDGQVAGRWKKKGKSLSVELFSDAGLKRRDTARRKALIRDKAESLWEDLSAVEFAE
ncbi:MAG: winged helix DNA-binding domain-containing protein [Roseburia sp.]|nr:winged helix DNA-binding domain-containing protein [Roseburia sp.]MCM1099246.1 winged helix DNA-binding domain-containing protein [Ruminococcus flavefaciens]